MNAHLTALGISSELITARGLRESEEAMALEVAEVGADGRDHLLIPLAAEAWRHLKAAALVDGIDLFIVSAFRSIDRQAEIVRRKLETGAAIESILTICAPPGFSEHRTLPDTAKASQNIIATGAGGSGVKFPGIAQARFLCYVKEF